MNCERYPDENVHETDGNEMQLQILLESILLDNMQVGFITPLHQIHRQDLKSMARKTTHSGIIYSFHTISL